MDHQLAKRTVVVLKIFLFTAFLIHKESAVVFLKAAIYKIVIEYNVKQQYFCFKWKQNNVCGWIIKMASMALNWFIASGVIKLIDSICCVWL